MGVGWAGLFSLEGAQAGFWAAPAHVGGGRAAPCRPRGPAHFPEPSGQHRPVPFGPLTQGGGQRPVLSRTGCRDFCDPAIALLFTLPQAVGVTVPLCSSSVRFSSLGSALSLELEVSPGLCEEGGCSGLTALGPKVMPVDLESQARLGLPVTPGFPPVSGPLSCLLAAGVSPPRKGLAPSSPPSEASAPAEAGYKAQVGRYLRWASGVQVERVASGYNCQCRVHRVVYPFPVGFGSRITGQGRRWRQETPGLGRAHGAVHSTGFAILGLTGSNNMVNAPSVPVETEISTSHGVCLILSTSLGGQYRVPRCTDEKTNSGLVICPRSLSWEVGVTQPVTCSRCLER